jgi:hypothetical protein
MMRRSRRRDSNRGSVLLLFALALLLGGCAHFTSYSAGSALAVGDGRRAGAVSLEVAEGSGGSTESSSTLAEGRARALVGIDRQQLSGVVGPSHLRWIGARTPLWTHLAVGPGLERLAFDGTHTVFFEAIAQARVTTGFVLDEVWESGVGPFGVGEAALVPRDPRALQAPLRMSRRRTLLTVGLAGDVDARFTRAPLFVVSLMIGITLLEEPRVVSLPRFDL